MQNHLDNVLRLEKPFIQSTSDKYESRLQKQEIDIHKDHILRLKHSDM